MRLVRRGSSPGDGKALRAPSRSAHALFSPGPIDRRNGRGDPGLRRNRQIPAVLCKKGAARTTRKIQESSMSQENPANEELSFSEQLLGMQGFSAARAKRYRSEIDKLLVHRLPKFHRWAIGIMGVYLAVAFGILGVMAVMNRQDPITQNFPETRWAVAAALIVPALTLC